ncbi:(deoxy)nucleoside triphosphate pyrophosphohydrolase [Microlunatus elymi]|uniref:8-oxo-dGTP diphosphatase n=1 Tax=Microlunatus elymi TaxID=2596828 RepID=A0A516PUQ5_9ACTN|nr:(deoxy)nucleoside triphosphate pyrophosphohydrolase [Microlunatus elymi]QDP94889.1 (deoxy)nucleoside triphosphate pyrophosphohydrolase [Microlunatus elymi]
MRQTPTEKLINVVGAVIVRDGQVLCAQRGSEGELSGRWEFPGGKIEPSESARAALRREIREELDCEVQVGEKIISTTHEYDFGLVTLTTYYCSLITGIPKLTEHAELRWLPRSRLTGLHWAPADLPTVKLIMNRSS